MRKEGKSTRYALVCFYISSFAHSRARFKSFTRTFGKNFVFVLERGREKQISTTPEPFFYRELSKRFEVSESIREGEKRKRIAGKRRRQFSSLEDFSCVRVWWLFRFKRTTKRTRRAKFFSERWISFSLSVKSVKTRTAFLPDLGSVLTYFEGKKEEFWREKTTTKIHHHRFKRLHTTERDSSQISPLLTLSSNTRASQDLFFLANTTRSILQRNDERGRSLSLPKKEIASLALR